MNILNLYSGIGGNRKLWEGHQVTAVEINEKIGAVYGSLYPNDELIIGDAHEYLTENYEKFDFIWSSPPCQSHSKMVGQNQTPRYIDMKLYQEIIFLNKYFKKSWIVENVEPYYKPLVNYKFRFGRHLFWSNFTVGFFNPPKSKDFINQDDPLELMDWLGIHYDGHLYYDGNHSPAQVLRNAVHPLIGEYVLECSTPKTLFD